MIKRKGIGLKSMPDKRKVAHKVKRGKIKALWSVYGLKVPLYRRYSGRKGIYWYLFSKSIRERDYNSFGGLCMTCEKYVQKGQDQCGHFFPAANCGFDLLFNRRNNHLQHASCNNPRFSPHAGIYNTRTLTKRYGAGTVDELEQIKSRPNQKEWSQKEYDTRIKILLQELKATPQVQ
jgi:hypothetical protein